MPVINKHCVMPFPAFFRLKSSSYSVGKGVISAMVAQNCMRCIVNIAINIKILNISVKPQLRFLWIYE